MLYEVELEIQRTIVVEAKDSYDAQEKAREQVADLTYDKDAWEILDTNPFVA